MIELVGVTVRAGGFCLREVSFAVPLGEYAVLMGPSGSGKTTLLEAVCGLKAVAAGAIFIDGREVTRLRPAERGIGFVPQEGALFATMTVAEHLAFALRVRRQPRAEIARRVDELAELLGLRALLGRRPQGLSGGERQRVALGRALAFRPSVLCLDEPLSSLDDDARFGLVELLKRVQRETHVTALHVTHHRSEAETLADVRLQLTQGRIEALAK